MYDNPNDVIIYTDGSLDPLTGKAGCGIYIRLGNVVTKKSYRIGKNASSLQAELLAIDFAIKIVVKQYPNIGIMLLTDSLGALQTIKKLAITDNIPVVHSCYKHQLTLNICIQITQMIPVIILFFFILTEQRNI